MNKIALITGATSGIGEAFARKLAQQGYDLIITGRREEKIRVLADELQKDYLVKVEVLIMELSDPQSLSDLEQKVKNIPNLDMLINNAGFNVYAYFFDGGKPLAESLLNVHALVTIKLTYAALQNMIARKSGAIINVSSIGAFSPFASGAMYVGTKGFISLLTESIGLELKKKAIPVRIQTLCPGITISDFQPKINPEMDAVKMAKSRGWLWRSMAAEQVVEISLKYLNRDKVICVPGFFNKIIVLINTFKRLKKVFF